MRVLCVAMQGVFLWQDNDIIGSDAVRVLCVAMQGVFLWQDNDINGNDAVPVLCILAGQRNQL